MSMSGEARIKRDKARVLYAEHAQRQYKNQQGQFIRSSPGTKLGNKNWYTYVISGPLNFTPAEFAALIPQSTSTPAVDPPHFFAEQQSIAMIFEYNSKIAFRIFDISSNTFSSDLVTQYSTSSYSIGNVNFMYLAAGYVAVLENNDNGNLVILYIATNCTLSHVHTVSNENLNSIEYTHQYAKDVFAYVTLYNDHVAQFVAYNFDTDVTTTQTHTSVDSIIEVTALNNTIYYGLDFTTSVTFYLYNNVDYSITTIATGSNVVVPSPNLLMYAQMFFVYSGSSSTELVYINDVAIMDSISLVGHNINYSYHIGFLNDIYNTSGYLVIDNNIDKELDVYFFQFFSGNPITDHKVLSYTGSYIIYEPDMDSGLYNYYIGGASHTGLTIVRYEVSNLTYYSMTNPANDVIVDYFAPDISGYSQSLNRLALKTVENKNGHAVFYITGDDEYMLGVFKSTGFNSYAALDGSNQPFLAGSYPSIASAITEYYYVMGIVNNSDPSITIIVFDDFASDIAKYDYSSTQTNIFSSFRFGHNTFVARLRNNEGTITFGNFSLVRSSTNYEITAQYPSVTYDSPSQVFYTLIDVSNNSLHGYSASLGIVSLTSTIFASSTTISTANTIIVMTERDDLSGGDPYVTAIGVSYDSVEEEFITDEFDIFGEESSGGLTISSHAITDNYVMIYFKHINAESFDIYLFDLVNKEWIREKSTTISGQNSFLLSNNAIYNLSE